MGEQKVNKQAEVTSGVHEKNLVKKKIGIICAIAVVIIAVVMGVGIYNAPSNQLSRQLELGQKYLAEQDYERAILAFEKAIDIDEKCLAAYVGGIEAYLQTGDEEGVVAIYERATGIIGGFDDQSREINKDDAVKIYLYADEVYAESDKIVEILEESLTIYNDNLDIIDKLIDQYIEMATTCKRDGNYEEALKYYARALQHDGENEKAQNGLNELLKEYIDLLIQERRYDEVRVLGEEYSQVETNINFDEMLQEIEELEQEENAVVFSDEEIAIIADAYAMRMEGMWDNKFEVCDITNDGIPEIIGAGGVTIITYTPWNQSAEIIWDEMVLYDLYFSKDMNKVLAYTSNWDKTDEMLLEVTIAVAEGENPFSWAKTEWIDDYDRLDDARIIVDGVSCCVDADDRTFANSIARYNNDAETRNNLAQILKENMQH